jgi:hypothetical protein
MKATSGRNTTGNNNLKKASTVVLGGDVSIT